MGVRQVSRNCLPTSIVVDASWCPKSEIRVDLLADGRWFYFRTMLIKVIVVRSSCDNSNTTFLFFFSFFFFFFSRS